VVAAVTALVGLAVVPGLPEKDPEPERSLGVVAGLRTGGLVRPATVFLTTTMAAGAAVTFLPLAAHGMSALALLGLSAAATLTRWWGGRHGDRHGSARLFVPAVAVSGAGVLVLFLLPNPVAVLGGMVLFGAGFGAAQSASLSLMFERVAPSGYGTASAVWNLAYDAGLGLGATAFGVLAAWTGYPAAFACGAALIVAAIPLALRDGRVSPASRAGRSSPAEAVPPRRTPGG
jgi:predicted MFS family arabinose efflux permease